MKLSIKDSAQSFFSHECTTGDVTLQEQNMFTIIEITWLVFI